MAKIHDELEAAKTEADRVINDEHATPASDSGYRKIDEVQPKLDNAIVYFTTKQQ